MLVFFEALLQMFVVGATRHIAAFSLVLSPGSFTELLLLQAIENVPGVDCSLP